MLLSTYYSFLVEEWRYLNEQSASLDLLIVDQVWERLPGLISVKTIAVYISLEHLSILGCLFLVHI